MAKITKENSETVFISQGWPEQRTTDLVAESNRNSFYHSSGGWKSEIKVLVLLPLWPAIENPPLFLPSPDGHPLSSASLGLQLHHPNLYLCDYKAFTTLPNPISVSKCPSLYNTISQPYWVGLYLNWLILSGFHLQGPHFQISSHLRYLGINT